MSENESSSDRPEGVPEPVADEVPSGESPEPLISIDHFASVVLKVGVVVEAAPHPDADRLLVLKVDVGEDAPRQIVAGIRAHWEPDELVSRKVVICCNLKPAKLRGIESQGMMLAVSGASRVWPLSIEGEVDPGTRVT